MGKVWAQKSHTKFWWNLTVSIGYLLLKSCKYVASACKFYGYLWETFWGKTVLVHPSCILLTIKRKNFKYTPNIYLDNVLLDKKENLVHDS